MTSTPITAAECLRLGWVDELHDPGALAPAALELAKHLAAGATRCAEPGDAFWQLNQDVRAVAHRD